jgi:hypothetical protein
MNATRRGLRHRRLRDKCLHNSLKALMVGSTSTISGRMRRAVRGTTTVRLACLNAIALLADSEYYCQLINPKEN